MNAKPGIVPIGIEHLSLVMRESGRVTSETAKHFDEFRINREIIGTGLSILYQAATCHRHGNGGAHILERLCGRAYNLGCGAYNLTVTGLYDEALNLIRGMGEMTNLLVLSAVDPPAIREWLHAGRKDRLNKFSPVKVRRMLEDGGHPVCATEDWYKELSEGYTHVTPDTQPNFHGGLAWVGGKYETEGMKKCFGKLLYVLTFLGFLICKYFKFEDLFAELDQKLRKSTDD